MNPGLAAQDLECAQNVPARGKREGDRLPVRSTQVAAVHGPRGQELSGLERGKARNRFARLDAEGALLRDRDREVPLPIFAWARPVRGCRRWTPGNLLVIRDGVTRRRCAVSAAGMRHRNSR